MRRECDDIILPPGFSKIEYIQATGTQYIDSGYYPSNLTELEVDCQFLNAVRDSAIFWVRWTGSPTYYTFGLSHNATANLWIYINTESSIFYGSSSAPDHNNRGVLELKNHRFKFLSYSYNFNASTVFASSYSLCIFGGNTTGTVSASPGNKRIYRFKIIENGQLVRDYMPALRISDVKPGLYDLCGSVCHLTGTPFYTNAGTGEFLYS